MSPSSDDEAKELAAIRAALELAYDRIQDRAGPEPEPPQDIDVARSQQASVHEFIRYVITHQKFVLAWCEEEGDTLSVWGDWVRLHPLFPLWLGYLEKLKPRRGLLRKASSAELRKELFALLLPNDNLKRGVTTKASAALGHIAAHGTPEEKKARWAELQKHKDKLRAEFPLLAP